MAAASRCTSLLFLLQLIAGFALLNTSTAQQQTFRDVDDLCLQCICMASTGCDMTKGCITMDGNKFCGAFQISKGYWLDAGQPVKEGAADNSTAFEDCATDKACSENAVRHYLLKYVRNCNQDTILDCEDIARLHKAGPFACDQPSVEKSPYWDGFMQCYYS